MAARALNGFLSSGSRTHRSCRSWCAWQDLSLALTVSRLRSRHVGVMVRGRPKVASRLLSPNLASEDTRAPATDTTRIPLAR